MRFSRYTGPGCVPGPLHWIRIPGHVISGYEMILENQTEITLEECKTECRDRVDQCLGIEYIKANSSCSLKTASPLDVPLSLDTTTDLYMYCEARTTNGELDCIVAGISHLHTEAWTKWFYISIGPLTRCVKLHIAHAPGMPGTFSPPLTSKAITS